jgi:hypothetical protein
VQRPQAYRSSFLRRRDEAAIRGKGVLIRKKALIASVSGGGGHADGPRVKKTQGVESPSAQGGAASKGSRASSSVDHSADGGGSSSEEGRSSGGNGSPSGWSAGPSSEGVSSNKRTASESGGDSTVDAPQSKKVRTADRGQKVTLYIAITSMDLVESHYFGDQKMAYDRAKQWLSNTKKKPGLDFELGCGCEDGVERTVALEGRRLSL